MITAGIDMGGKTIKVVILKDKQVLAKSIVTSGFEHAEAAKTAFDDAVKKAGISANQIEKVFATGIGKADAPYKTGEVTEVGADAKGMVFLMPSARTVIDVGAEEGRGVKCDANGKVIDFVINEKCAAGSGSFTEAMARALEVSLEDFGKLSLKSTQSIPMNAQCAVFAESEVISLIHSKISKEDIARAVHDAIANRITSMILKIGVDKDVALIGGVSHNAGFVDSMKRTLNTEITVAKEPEYVGALGAALLAAE